MPTLFASLAGRLKTLHRLIVTSATYRQSSAFNANAAEIRRGRSTALAVRPAGSKRKRSAMPCSRLPASSTVKAAGPSFRPFRIETFNSAFYIPFDADRPDFNRRSIYRMNVTSARDPVLDVLDCPDPSVKTPRRTATTTPLQALTLMNNPFTNRLAKAFAKRLIREAGDDAAAQVNLAYRLALGRGPSVTERNRAINAIRDAGLDTLSWAILNSSEFAYMK